MIVKMNQILSFCSFMENFKEAKVPLKTAYKINKLLQKMEVEKTFYQKSFSDIIQTYGKKDANGNYIFSQDGVSIEIKEELREECVSKVIELENLEIEIEDIFFSIDELDFLNLTIQDMNSLMPFIQN